MNLQREPCAGRTPLVRGLLAAAVIFVAGTAAGEQPAAASPDSSTPPRSASSSPDQKLHQACEQGDLLLLKAAIAEHADVNCASTNGLPPLLELFRPAVAPLDPARRECVACLLAHGAKPDVADGDQRTAVIYATRLGDLDTLRVLVEGEANVRTRDRDHKTALFYAVEAGRRDIAQYLAQNGGLISLSVKERRQMRREE